MVNLYYYSKEFEKNMYSQEYKPSYDYDPREVAYRHLATAMLISAVVIGIMTIFPFQDLYFLYSIGSLVEIGIIFLLFFAGLFRKQFSESTALTVLLIFAIASSITFGFIINIALILEPMAVFLTFGTTGVVVFGIWTYARINKPNTSRAQKWAMIISILFLVFVLIGMFTFSSDPIFYLVLSGVGAFIFALYMYIDFARLERYEFNSPAMMALWLFYDIIYFMKYLLMFLLAIMGNDN